MSRSSVIEKVSVAATGHRRLGMSVGTKHLQNTFALHGPAAAPIAVLLAPNTSTQTSTQYEQKGPSGCIDGHTLQESDKAVGTTANEATEHFAARMPQSASTAL
jgi:hypothetical protein